jgi:hypothetical protein
METINGEWYMKGCAPDDPARLRSAEDLAALVERIGFLPLFSNEIPGFSVEERTTAQSWWSSDPEDDPWEWRIALAKRQELGYGKLFDRKAAYVSAAWFPVLANYRRDGWDFDALWDEGLAPWRAKKLMDALEPDEEGRGLALLSPVLKEKAGFGKGGEKNFEGVQTDLQMQCYLLVSEFRQRRNRAGRPYGWHLSVLQTPETKWGREAVTACYREDPAASLRRLEENVLRFLPQADPEALHRLLRVRRPQAGGRTG